MFERRPGARDGVLTPDGTRLCVADSAPQASGRPGNTAGAPGSDAGTTGPPGSDEAGAGAEGTVVLVHGWTQDHTGWDPVLPWLPENLRVLRYDHRGHGKSSPAQPGTATIAQLADDLACVLDQRVPVGPITLAGHSMGGMTIMALAERYPELVANRVRGAAFVATSSGQMDRITLGLPGAAGRGVGHVEQVLRVLLDKRRKNTLPGNPRLLGPAARWLVFGRAARRADVLAATRQALAAHPASIAGFWDSIHAHDRRMALCALRGAASVVLAGDRDRLCPVAHARVIAEELPGACYARFPGAGHMLCYERPREVAEHIRALARRPAPTG